MSEICDSEDEDGIECLPDCSDRVATVSSGEGAPANVATTCCNVAVQPVVTASGPGPEDQNELDQDQDQDQEIGNASASTEELLRQAHRDLMAPTQTHDAIRLSSNPSPSNATRAKRRSTAIDATSTWISPVDAPSLTRGKLKRIKTGPPTSQSDTTVPGPTIPMLDASNTNDTIAGGTFPSDQLQDHVPHTIVGRTCKYTNIQQSPARDQPSTSTTLSPSAFLNSSAFATASNCETSDPNGSDDAMIALPQERYNPRPSRSRSEKALLVEPIDYSVRPERAAKARRTRTIGLPPVDEGQQSVGPRIFPDYPILQAPPVEPLSPVVDPADLSTRPNLTMLDEGCLLQTTPDATASDLPATGTQVKNAAKNEAKPKKQPGRRGRPKKDPLPDPTVDKDDELASDEIATPRKRPRRRTSIQVVITKEDFPPTAAPSTQAILDALNKKYPPCDLNAAPDATVEDDNKHEFTNKNERNKEADPNVLSEKEAKEQEQEEQLPTSNSVSISHGHASSQQSIEKEEVQNGAAKTPQPAFKQARTFKSSPIVGKGPVYRVGLSRTQKTQSLLKMFRK